MPERISLRIVGNVHRVCGKVAWADQGDASDLLQTRNDSFLDRLEDNSLEEWIMIGGDAGQTVTR